MRTYVDTNVLVYAFSAQGSPKRAVARAAMVDAISRGPLTTTFLAVDEFIWVLRKPHGYGTALEQAHLLLEYPITFLPIGEAEGRRALALMQEHGLKPHDATHAAAALEHGCARILSTNADFDAVAGLERIGLG